MLNKGFSRLIYLVSLIVLNLLSFNSLKGDNYSVVGDVFACIGLYHVALSFYLKAKQSGIDIDKINEKLATLHIKLKDYSGAVTLFEKTNVKDEDYKSHYKWAKALFKLGKYFDAIEQFEKSIKSNPAFVSSYFGLGSAFEELELYDQALEKYETALSLDPQNAHIYVSIGLVEDDRGYPIAAIQAFRQALVLDPVLPDAYFAWGTVLERLGDIDGAIEKYVIAVNIDPLYADVYARWGEALYLKGEYHCAVEKYKKAIELDANFTWAIYDLACAYAKLENSKDAVRYLKIALSLDETLIDDVKSNCNLLNIIEVPEIKHLCQTI